jgi:hypothetical protein
MALLHHHHHLILLLVQFLKAHVKLDHVVIIQISSLIFNVFYDENYFAWICVNAQIIEMFYHLNLLFQDLLFLKLDLPIIILLLFLVKMHYLNFQSFLINDYLQHLPTFLLFLINHLLCLLHCKHLLEV